jgi:hypothetical protein
MPTKGLSPRPKQQQEFMRGKSLPPLLLFNFLDDIDLKLLYRIYDDISIATDHHDKAVSKHQIRFVKDKFLEEMTEWVAYKFGSLLGQYTIDRIFGSTSESPTQIHVDATNVEGELPPYRNIMIPISVNNTIDDETEWSKCSTVYFDQLFYARSGKALFKKGYRSENAREDIEVYDYSTLDNLRQAEFPLVFYKDYLTHLPYAHLEGLSVAANCSWQPRSPILFDRNRLHTSNNYLIKGVTTKRFVCIFTNHTETGL